MLLAIAAVSAEVLMLLACIRKRPTQSRGSRLRLLRKKLISKPAQPISSLKAMALTIMASAVRQFTQTEGLEYLILALINRQRLVRKERAL